ncbi:MAG TPA: thioredoxin-disulfide reductase [Fimbriimonadaceae bacterium]|nr:thioredoxin-disulfide reductase [Fimbriimonadaceae bacterium]HRJ95517.1 thioredoxin-disulfide reductase [Fimbriimonadaceae bacterium]
MVHEVIIIGSGPAGYTAALYAARADLNPLLFAGILPGGQLMITTDVENYPGFPEGILGPEMMALFRKQVERFGTTIRDEEVTKVDLSSRPFRLWAGEEELAAKAVVVATGASAKWLGLDSEVTYGGYGVSACATCDGFFFRGKEVLVVGGGDTAMEEANYLTRHASKVYLVHRRDSFRASKIMQDRVLANPKIEVVWNTVLDEILGVSEPHRKVTGVRLRSALDDSVRDMPIDGVFIAIGHKPNSDLFKDWLDMDDLGYLKVEPYSTRTKIPGVFVCGDVADSVYRQAVTAAGTGCMAAIDAERWLEAQAHAEATAVS